MSRHFPTSHRQGDKRKKYGPAKPPVSDLYSRRSRSPSRDMRKPYGPAKPPVSDLYYRRSRSPSRDMRKQYGPTKPPVSDLYSRKRSPSRHTRDSSKGGRLRETNRSSEDYYKSLRSYPKERREKKKEPKKTDSRTDVLEDFITGIHDLPNKIFFKLLDKKLDELFKKDRFTQLGALAEFINRASDVVANSLPPDVDSVGLLQDCKNIEEMNIHFPISHEEADKREQYGPAKPPDSDLYTRRSRSPSRQSRERSYPKERRGTKNLPQKAENRKPDSGTDVLEYFSTGIHALPNEIFFKILDMKLESFTCEGFTQLAALAEFISAAKDFVAKSLPRGVETDVKLMMYRKDGTFAEPPGSDVASC